MITSVDPVAATEKLSEGELQLGSARDHERAELVALVVVDVRVLEVVVVGALVVVAVVAAVVAAEEGGAEWSASRSPSHRPGSSLLPVLSLHRRVPAKEQTLQIANLREH